MLLLQFKIVVCLYISFYTYNTHVPPSKAIIFLSFLHSKNSTPSSVTPEFCRSYSSSRSWSHFPSRSRSCSPTRHSHTHITAITKIESERHDHLVLMDARTVRDLDTNAREACRDSDHKEHSKRPRNHHHHHSHE